MEDLIRIVFYILNLIFSLCIIYLLFQFPDKKIADPWLYSNNLNTLEYLNLGLFKSFSLFSLNALEEITFTTDPFIINFLYTDSSYIKPITKAELYNKVYNNILYLSEEVRNIDFFSISHNIIVKFTLSVLLDSVFALNIFNEATVTTLQYNNRIYIFIMSDTLYILSAPPFKMFLLLNGTNKYHFYNYPSSKNIDGYNDTMSKSYYDELINQEALIQYINSITTKYSRIIMCAYGCSYTSLHRISSLISIDRFYWIEPCPDKINLYLNPSSALIPLNINYNIYSVYNTSLNESFIDNKNIYRTSNNLYNPLTYLDNL